MEFPPDEWLCFPIEDYEAAVPRNPGTLGIEVMAQVRNDGRVVDHFRAALGGSETVKVRFTTKAVFLSERLPSTALIYEVWPRDITIRRNMATSEWLDLNTLLASNDVLVDVPAEEAGGSADPVTNDGLNALLNGAKDKPTHTASIRWAVGVGGDGHLELILQAFPASATVLSGKPAFRG